MIPNKSPVPLTGDKCYCHGCGELFGRTSVFEAHRVGKGADRRCLSTSILEERGFRKDSKGFWRHPAPKRPIGLGMFS